MSLHVHAIVTASLPETADEVLAPRGPVPVSRSPWWAGETGRFPEPVKLGRAPTAGQVEDTRALIARPNPRND